MSDTTLTKGAYIEQLNFEHSSDGRLSVSANCKVVNDEGVLELTAEFVIGLDGQESWNDIKRMVGSRIRRALQEFPE